MATTWGKRECVSTREGILFQKAIAQHTINVIFKAWKKTDISALYYHAIRKLWLLKK